MRVCVACGSALASDSWTCAACSWAPGKGPFPLFASELAGLGESFPPSSFQLLPEWEQRSFWFRSRNKLVIWALQKHFAHARSFLEVGSGTGFVLRGLRTALPELELTAAELFVEGLEVTRGRVPDATLIQADARRLPFRDEFDVVGAFDVLEHVKEDEQALCELHRAVAPGGGLIVTVPQHPSLWSAADCFGHHERRYTRKELVEKLQQAGFEIARVTSFMTFLLPLMAASRVRMRRSAAPFDAAGEFSIAPAADRMLERVLDVERVLIRRGVSLPFGGSLLAVARRP